MITGKDLIEAGAKPGKWFPGGLATAEEILANGGSREKAIAAALAHEPKQLPLGALGELDYHMNIKAADKAEEANVAAVRKTMDEVMRTPGVVSGAVMPDACPAGPVGTIPVGGVVASKNIHPGMHSADICCSVAFSSFGKTDPAHLLDAVEKVTHFGPGGRDEPVPMPGGLGETFEAHPMLAPHAVVAKHHFATQGDGNHFAYVGTLASSGETVLVTHHGSRAPGARLYKAGMVRAERRRQEISPQTPKGNAWIEADSREGEDYWAALQIIRAWTKASHFAIHDLAGSLLGEKVTDRFWNEHNFVFRKSDGLFYHAKGATPAFDGWSEDATQNTLIPLNMAQPILIAQGRNAGHGLGFAPHGAGRNLSRTAHKRLLEGETDESVFARETTDIDARFHCGKIDVSELPSAYKNAAAVRKQIKAFKLAKIVDEVRPHGSIMAGDWEADAPWRKKREAKRRRAMRQSKRR